jgi:hypothetical protein
MNANISTEEKETDKGFSNTQARANDPGKASIGRIDDASHLVNRIACATLIERVVGFMERYN